MTPSLLGVQSAVSDLKVFHGSDHTQSRHHIKELSGIMPDSDRNCSTPERKDISALRQVDKVIR